VSGQITSHFLPLEDLPATSQNFVQRFTEIRRGFRHLSAHLFGVLLPALLDLFLEQLLQVPIAKSFLALAGMVHDHVGDERSGQTFCLERRILREEGVWWANARRPGRSR
jgi:hypothetical protein